MFVIVAKHFKNQFSQGESVFKSFKRFELRGVPYAYDISIDGPDDVIKEIAQ